MKGQMELMEYLFLTVFVILIIIVLMFFITGWQVTQSGIERTKEVSDEVTFLMKKFSTMDYFVKEDGVFDDAKLTVLSSMENVCEELRPILGSNWFATITVFDESGSIKVCTESNYPDCNHWSFCKKENRDFVSRKLPVNIYRNTNRIGDSIFAKNDIGVLEVGFYEI